MSEDPGHRPTLRVISAAATDEEIAAILALVGARGSAVAAERAAAVTASQWRAPGAGHRRSQPSFRPHCHGWRTSYWPG
jgi:hypothetical protein